MKRRSYGLFLLAACATAWLPSGSPAQNKAQEVTFQTRDAVDIKGTFYPGGGKAPAILLLHELGSDRQKGGWDQLAQKLSAEGFAVLTFDFRAHNDSTAVDPKIFWNTSSNSHVFKPNKDRDKIALADLIKNQKTYLPMLINDIAAAKHYLDQRNDAGDCNTSNTILVGSKEGAALGALWMSREMRRQRLVPNPFNPNFFILDPKMKIEGEDLRAAVWLSIPEKLSGQSLSFLLKNASIRDRVPMVFLYGDKDDVASKSANAIFNAMKSGSSKSFETTTRLRKKDTKSAGVEMLGKQGLDTEDDIVSYVKNVMQRKAEKPYVKRDAEKMALPALILP